MGPVGYQLLEDRKDTGAHYTPKALADFVADKISEQFKATPSIVTAMDPAIGDGELLAALGNALTKKKVKAKLLGFDIDEMAVSSSNKKISKLFPEDDITIRVADFIDDFDDNPQNTLFSSEKVMIPKADLVIANPPYIRSQVLGSEKSRRLAKKFDITGRLDMYQAFVNQIANCLNEGGIAGIILSNRFMYTQGGRSTREYILRNFEVLSIWDLGDTKIFEAAVLPVVLILKKREISEAKQEAEFTSIYSTKESQQPLGVTNIFDHLDKSQIVEYAGSIFEVKKGKLHFSDGEPWRISAEKSDAWLGSVAQNTFCSFGDISKIKVGVKTTADKVFIQGSSWLDEADSPEMLRPLITHHIAKRYHSDKPKYSILYTHILDDNSKKKAIELDKYPKSKKYLLKHREQLSSRKYVIDSGRNWYEIWVPHSPSDWAKPKIIFRDISEKPTFWAEFGEAVVNGDCYWMAIPSDKKDLTWLLLAIANSTFIEKFYDHKFSNKLYSGRRRYITQYVSKFPVLDPQSEPAKKIVTMAKSIYEKAIKDEDYSQLEQALDSSVYKAFGVS